MVQKLIISIGGLIIVLLAGTLFFVFKTSDAERIAAQEKIKALTKDVEEKRVELSNQSKSHDGLEAQIAKLQAELAELKQGPQTKQKNNPIQDLLQNSRGFINEAKIQKYLSRLNLSPEQEKALREYFEKETAAISNYALNKESVSSDDLPSERDFMKGLLSESQYLEYQKLRDDAVSSVYETIAHTELMQMQDLFELSEDQKDRIYTAIYEAESKPTDSTDFTGVDGSIDLDPTMILKKRLEKRLEALRDVLSPEQLDIYRQYAEKQVAAQEKMMKVMKPFLPNQSVNR